MNTEKMHRKAFTQLLEWKERANRKPLVIKGARQVGKTWLAQEFGRTQYENVAYINLDGNTQARNLFELDYDVDRIIEGLELIAETPIKPSETLLILDEIQEIPRALSALKYFYENRPDYHVVVAGSLLGVALHQGTSFPVGKVEFIELYPLNFTEFLRATGNERFADLIEFADNGIVTLQPFHDELLSLLKTYYIVGGMPEVVATYAQENSLLRVREVQSNILSAYEQDFSKHAPISDVPRLREIWDIIPAQLAKENKRFIFRLMREGARAKQYEMALLWLEDSGLAHRVARINKPSLPLSAYADNTIFKLFMLDVGLLGAKSNLEPTIILNDVDIFVEFKGALTEQFVFQELMATGKQIYYYANDDSRGEIDFMTSLEENVVPIEVKAGKTTTARSLQKFVDKYESERALILSTQKYMRSGRISKIPLYFIGGIR